VEVIKKALADGHRTLTEYESKQVLKKYGIPVTREIEVDNRESLTEAIREIGFPLVLKGCGPTLSHKTERNLVHVDIRSMKEAAKAFEEIMAKVKNEGGTVLVQEMVKGRRELLAGMTRDAQFGPCVIFGLGGIFTEILKDISFRAAPLERKDAFQMMQEIKGRKILEGVRGLPPADLNQIAEILTKLGSIGLEQEHIKEIDINPVLLDGSKPVAVDALVVLRG
jgi:acetyl-CoA synthetase (ADP-forming)